MCLSALLTAQAMSVFEWNSNTVDNILLQGDSKYRNSAFESGLIPRERYYFILLIILAKIVPCDISFRGCLHEPGILSSTAQEDLNLH